MARNEETNRRLRERSRETLLEAATELFASQGFNGTTMDGVAAAAGVSKGLAYNYFRSKSDILGTLLDARMSNLSRIISSVPAEGTAVERVGWLIDALFDDVEERPGLYRLYLSLSLHPDSVGKATSSTDELRSTLDDYFERLARVIGSLGGTEPEADLMFFRGAMMGLCLRLALSPGDFPREPVKERLIAGLVAFGRSTGGGTKASAVPANAPPASAPAGGAPGE